MFSQGFKGKSEVQSPLRWLDRLGEKTLLLTRTGLYFDLVLFSSGKNDFGRPPIKSHFPTGNADGKDSSISSFVTPMLGRALMGRTILLQELWDVFGWTYVEQSHFEKLFS